MWVGGTGDVGWKNRRCGLEEQAMWVGGTGDVGWRNRRCGLEAQAMVRP